MQRIKSSLKRLLTDVLYATGSVWRRLDRRTDGRLIVLTYHRVLPRELSERSFSSAGIIVSPETFDRHVRLLKSQCRVLTPDEAAEVLSGRMQCPKRACVITFDDGWWDNLAFAAPILARHGVPALLFVATDFLGSDEVFWQETASFQLFELWRAAQARPELLRKAGAQTLMGLNAAQVRPAIRDLVDGMKRLPVQQLQVALDRTSRVFSELGTSARRADPDRFLSWTELRELVQNAPFTIASHGCSHTPFTRLPSDILESELARSRECIRSRAGIEAVDLAYPNGDCNAEVAEATRRAGYRLAFTTERGYVSPGDDPMQLRRINIHEHGSSTDSLFAARLAGLI